VKPILLAMSMSLALVTAPAMAVDYRWTVGFNQGTGDAIIRDDDNSSFNIF
jgi:hypothetical protein